MPRKIAGSADAATERDSNVVPLRPDAPVVSRAPALPRPRPGTIFLADETGAVRVVDVELQRRNQALALESAARARLIVEMNTRAEQARVGRAKGSAVARAALERRRTHENAELRQRALAMKRRGLTQSAIARHLGVTRGRVARLLKQPPP